MNLISRISKHLAESAKVTYVVFIDKTEGGNDSKDFTDKAEAIACGEACAKKKDVIHVEVVEVNEEDGEETTIKSIKGAAS